MAVTECPVRIWEAAVRTLSDTSHVDCPRCGSFSVVGTLESQLRDTSEITEDGRTPLGRSPEAAVGGRGL